MKMLDVGLAGVEEIEGKILDSLKDIKLLKQLLVEINETENYELNENRDDEKIKFSQEQIDFICHQIGEWYLCWKNKIVNHEEKTHRLEMAKEELKLLICGQ